MTSGGVQFYSGYALLLTLTTYASSTLWLQTLTEDFYKSKPEFKKFMKKYDLQFKAYDTFGPDEIKERTELLAKLTRIIWE